MLKFRYPCFTAEEVERTEDRARLREMVRQLQAELDRERRDGQVLRRVLATTEPALSEHEARLERLEDRVVELELWMRELLGEGEDEAPRTLVAGREILNRR
jgi:hypothetical protein